MVSAISALARRLDVMTRAVAAVAVCVAVITGAVAWQYYALEDARLGLLYPPIGQRVRDTLGWALLTFVPMCIVYRVARGAVIHAFIETAGVELGLDSEGLREVASLFSSSR